MSLSSVWQFELGIRSSQLNNIIDIEHFWMSQIT